MHRKTKIFNILNILQAENTTLASFLLINDETRKPVFYFCYFKFENHMKILSLFAAVAAFALVSCTGSEGPMGPQGPAGIDGTNGNANVIASSWYTPTTWAGQSGDWYFDLSNANITKDVVESGVVLAYVSLPGDIYNAPVRPLPTYALGANWEFLIPDYGQIEFMSDKSTIPPAGCSFRYVIIPASYTFQATANTSSLLKSKAMQQITVNDLKTMPYSDVCKLLNIAE